LNLVNPNKNAQFAELLLPGILRFSKTVIFSITELIFYFQLMIVLNNMIQYI
jgi:hypothetical protein